MKTGMLLLGIIMVACAGCGGRLETSLEVAEVEAKREAVTQVEDHPLLSLPAGTVIDDLSGLEGCWASYSTQDYLGGTVVDSYEYYRFDLANGELNHQLLHRGPLIYDQVSESIYSIEITGSDRVTIQLQSLLLEYSALDPPGEEPREVEGEPFDLQITLDGDAFKIGDTGAPSLYFSSEVVAFRFDCVESEDTP